MRRIRIFRTELNLILHEVNEHPNLETGGNLFGLWTHGDSPTIFLASFPAASAIKQSHEFTQDPSSHIETESHLFETFGIQCVGMWHSHHHLGLPELSTGDLRRVKNSAIRHHRHRTCELLASFHPQKYRIPPNTARVPKDPRICLHPYLFTDATRLETAECELHVLDAPNPIRSAMYADADPSRHRIRHLLRLDLPEYKRMSFFVPRKPSDEIRNFGDSETIKFIEAIVQKYIPNDLQEAVHFQQMSEESHELKIDTGDVCMKILIENTGTARRVASCYIHSGPEDPRQFPINDPSDIEEFFCTAIQQFLSEVDRR